MNNFQYFDIFRTVNDKREIKGFKLQNKIKVVLISDPNINVSSCSVAIGSGYLQDEFEGTAHFLEHLLFMGSSKYPEKNEFHSYVQINGGIDNAFTGDNITCYYICLETSFLKKGIEILSWFFRDPLLDTSHIESEMEIIDSEHQKNVLSDGWIMDDIFKNFIKSDKSKKSKYVKFGTGNLTSLKNITKKDIMDYYNNYYTTDNMFVCIVDSKSIDSMISNYVDYFAEIPIKISPLSSQSILSNSIDSPNLANLSNPINSTNLMVQSDLSDSTNYTDSSHITNLKKELLNIPKEYAHFIDENIIIFESISEYKYLNFHFIFDADEKNIYQYQLICLINSLIGQEYINSLAYHLKENNLIVELSSNIEYFYDYQTLICLQLVLVNDNLENIKQIFFSVYDFIDKINNIDLEDFKKIYLNYLKVKNLDSLYDSTNDPISISNDVVDNMTKGNSEEYLLRKNYVPPFNNLTYSNFTEIMNSIIFKFTTNINFLNIPKNNFIKSKWYNSQYFIDSFNVSNIISNDKYTKFNFNINNVIGFANFEIPLYDNNNVLSIDKKKLPELIYSNDNLKKKIYLLPFNKYFKPISNITVIRKNYLYLDKYSKIIMNIYFALCDKILNYFLDSMSNYKMSFNVSLSRENLIYNYYGLCNQLNFFISQIITKIDYNYICANSHNETIYFNVIRELIESLNNFKYNSPYNLCQKYLSIILNNELFPDEKISFIQNLTWNDFKIKLNECLKYSNEYYILVGIHKNGNTIDNNNSLETYNYFDDSWIKNVINLLSLNNSFLINTNYDENNEANLNFSNLNDFILDKKYFTPNEINNCLIRYWKMEQIETIPDVEKIEFDQIKKIIKSKIIFSFIAEMLNEPLFDKVRTVDKLGYIVRAGTKTINSRNQMYFIIYFLVQSTYSIKKISNSLDDFNQYIKIDLSKNYDNYLENFNSQKKSKLIDCEKLPSDLIEEVSNYVDAILSKSFHFNINELFYEIINSIEFSSDVEPYLNKLVGNKFKYYHLILDKSNESLD